MNAEPSLHHFPMKKSLGEGRERRGVFCICVSVLPVCVYVVWKIGLYKVVEFWWLCVVYVIMFWNGRKESDGFFKSDLVYLLTLEMTQMQRLEFHVSQDIQSCLAKSEGML